MRKVEEVDRPPSGWFALSVMRKAPRKWDWVALMIDVDPNEYRPAEGRRARQCYVRVRGKHRNEEAAWDAICDMIAATKH